MKDDDDKTGDLFGFDPPKKKPPPKRGGRPPRDPPPPSDADEKAAARSAEIGWCIKCSLRSVTQEEWEIVMPWFKDVFLPRHLEFVGDQVLEAFRATKHDIALRDWRNRWGGLMSHWCTQGYMQKIGKAKVKAIHSHGELLCLYRSNFYSRSV